MRRVTVRWATTGAPRAAMSLLTDRELDRLAGLRVGADRARMAAAHVLARVVAAAELHVDPRAVEVRQWCRRCGGPHGRPVLLVDGRPGPKLSMAHAGTVVVVAIGPVPLGVDVEPRVQPPSALDAIETLALTPAMRASVACLSPAARTEALVRRWVRWEADAKARGAGITAPAREAQGGTFRTLDLDLGADHLGALAAAGRRRPFVDLAEHRWYSVRARAAVSGSTTMGRRRAPRSAPPPVRRG